MVTGGSGLVGKGIRHAVETTEKRDNEEWIFLTSKDGNLLDLKETEALFEKHKPTHVIHLAALVRALNGIYCIELIWKLHRGDYKSYKCVNFCRLVVCLQI